RHAPRAPPPAAAATARAADARLVLHQLAEAADGQDWTSAARARWAAEIATARDSFEASIAETEREHHNDLPIHPARVARELTETIDPDATVVIDSFTMSGWIAQWFKAHFAGQILDARPLAPVGP